MSYIARGKVHCVPKGVVIINKEIWLEHAPLPLMLIINGHFYDRVGGNNNKGRYQIGIDNEAHGDGLLGDFPKWFEFFVNVCNAV